jgi:glycosyltransferase involved in cell wall biosynthesis
VENNPIKITFIPKRRPFIKNATSRLRALYLIDYLQKLYPDKYIANLDDPENADIIVVNQSVSKENFLKILEQKKKRKTFLIYDVVGRQYDDAREAFNQVAQQADLITVANEIQKARIEELKLNKPCSILNDGIDYVEQLNPTLVPFNGSVVWFGNHQLGNLESAMWAINYISSHPEYSMGVIGNKTIKLDNVKLIEWKYEGFINNLKRYSLCFLSHDSSYNQKSNNRLLVTIANGIPTIVSNSSAYSDLLRKFKLDYAIVENETELQKAISILSDEEQRLKYLSEIQPYILENFNYNAVAKQFDQILNQNYFKTL